MSTVRRGQVGGAVRRARADEGGYVLVVVVMVVGLATVMGGGLFAERIVPRLAERTLRAERTVASLTLAAHEYHRRHGAFPTDVAALRTSGTANSLDLMTGDPFGQGADVGYSVAAGAVSITSRGEDGQLATSDDLGHVLPAQNAGRPGTRNRLRLLRAAFFMSPYMNDAAMSPTARALLRTALRDASITRRRLTHAAVADLPALQAQIAAAESAITSLLGFYGTPSTPSLATGPGGLLEQLGMPDTLGQDGFGNTLSTAVVGFASSGSDGVPGNGDDL